MLTTAYCHTSILYGYFWDSSLADWHIGKSSWMFRVHVWITTDQEIYSQRQGGVSPSLGVFYFTSVPDSLWFSSFSASSSCDCCLLLISSLSFCLISYIHSSLVIHLVYLCLFNFSSWKCCAFPFDFSVDNLEATKSSKDSAVMNLAPAVWTEWKTKWSSDLIVGKSKPLVLLIFSSVTWVFKAPTVFLETIRFLLWVNFWSA